MGLVHRGDFRPELNFAAGSPRLGLQRRGGVLRVDWAQSRGKMLRHLRSRSQASPSLFEPQLGHQQEGDSKASWSVSPTAREPAALARGGQRRLGLFRLHPAAFHFSEPGCCLEPLLTHRLAAPRAWTVAFSLRVVAVGAPINPLHRLAAVPSCSAGWLLRAQLCPILGDFP